MDIVFVILNYNIYKETIDCVESIYQNLDTKLFHIIIVDNGSSTNAYDILNEKYKNVPYVTVFQNSTNEGFARGNNRGITEARKYNPKYICCLNNDTVLEQKDFFNKLEMVYNIDLPAVIGPQVILKDGRVQHVNKQLMSIEYYKSKIEQLKNSKKSFSNIKEILLKNRIIYEINFLRKKFQKEKKSDYIDVILHGCCLIFTPIFFEKLIGFDERTFLYAEEQLLYIAIKKNGLHNRYSSKIQIRHLEDISTKSVKKNNKEKLIFIRENTLKSLLILVQELEANQDIVCKV
ncbi:MAG: glycosyltransferase family 2 protein [Treponema sp.]|nr:glycosyltransferase family 2 protein [Treponema sp.]